MATATVAVAAMATAMAAMATTMAAVAALATAMATATTHNNQLKGGGDGGTDEEPLDSGRGSSLHKSVEEIDNLHSNLIMLLFVKKYS
jgi:hypothetical protein